MRHAGSSFPPARHVVATHWNNYGETLFAGGLDAQAVASSGGGLTLRRYYGWDGKEGYLQATYQGMGSQLHCVQVPYENARLNEWRHVGVLWSLKEKRLELYLDGKLAGKAEPGEAEWHGVPWDNGRHSGMAWQIISHDHGKWVGTCRDEWYAYNRALKAEEIKANMELVKK